MRRDAIEPTPSSAVAPDEQERVPIFATWPRIYAAVVLSALAHMALIALFSHWPY
jgi:hypothetical protein